MTKSHQCRVFRSIAALAQMWFGAILLSITVSVAKAAVNAVPVYDTAAFSQITPNAAPTRVFTTTNHIFSLDAAAKKITVWKKTKYGTLVRQFSGIADVADGAGSKGSQFSSPYGMAKHPSQNIIAVTDKGTSAQRVVFYSYTETSTAVQFTYLGSFINLPNPADVAFFPNGDVAVCGNFSNGLDPYACTLSGAYSAMSLSSGNLFPNNGAAGTADGLDIDQETGNLFIASASRHCVYELAGSSVVRTYGTEGSSGASGGLLSNPSDLCVWTDLVLSRKRLLVADQYNSRISIFDMDFPATPVMTFGGYGSEPGQMSRPFSVYAKSGSSEIAVADTVNRRIQLFGFDTDGDGLTDGDEIDLGADPQDADSDDDSLTDGDEVFIYKTDPADSDSDDDGLRDDAEVFTYGTDPNKADSDGDGLSDGDEVTRQTDPLDLDTDDDGLEDGEEVATYGTDPKDSDSDDDGLEDGDEVTRGTDPLDSDTDGDGLIDGGTNSNPGEVNDFGTDPLDPDTDGDGLEDGEELYFYGTDPVDPDTDGDGLEDGYEVHTVGSDPLDPNDPGSYAVLVPSIAFYNENTSVTQSLTVMLGAMPTSQKQIAVSGFIPGAVESVGDTLLTFPPGVQSAVLHFVALNGFTTCDLSFTPVGWFSGAQCTVVVANVAPSILSATASTNTVTAGDGVELSATATDPSADVLTYQWTFDDGSPAIDGPTVTNVFLNGGVVQATVTVTDQDGASDSRTLTITVEGGAPIEIDFTAITTNSVTFRIPTSAKSNNYLIKTSEVLALPDVSWTDWLFINGTDIVGVGGFGTFTAPVLVAPGYDVNITVEDSTNALTLISFDILELYNTYTNQFFKAVLTAD